MNKRFLLIILVFSSFCSFLYPFVNELKTVEICTKRFAPQLLLEFRDVLYFEKKANKDTAELELAFPAMNIKNFEDKNILDEIKKLGSLIKDARLFYSKVPSPRVILRVHFARNDILIRWNKIDDPPRLIMDFFSKEDLKELYEKGKRLLNASHNPEAVKNSINFNSEILSRKNLRILVDAGHGGEDIGARGYCFLQEKDIALDIAKRARFFLKKKGFNVFLTRSGVQTLSLKDRSELAGQLNADLFVSIHVNAVPAASKASGVESYFLNGKDFLPPVRKGGFLFVFDQDDKKLAKFTDLALKNNINLSEQLALSIQNNIVKFLDKKKLPVIDRGVKKNTFRVLLRSEIPVALVEVGFITNESEAKRLKTAKYRQLVASAICQGIEKYIDRMQLVAS